MVKKGDLVVVITGEDKGVRGIIKEVNPRASKVVVAGVNVVKKHQAGRGKVKAGVVEFEAPISLSNVMLVCPRCNEPARTGTKIDGESKVRVCKKCGATL